MGLHQKILTEEPLEIEGEVGRASKKVKGSTTIQDQGSFISDGSLKRNYTQIGSFATAAATIDFYRLDKLSTIGVYKAPHPLTGESSNHIIFMVLFKPVPTLKQPPPEIDKAKLLQVGKAAVHKEFEGLGIASYAYALLVKQGYQVLSDFIHYTAGKKLWKRIAAKAKLSTYKVFILDDEKFLEKDGKPVEYDSANIDDAEIWSKDPDDSKLSVLLLMK